MRANKHAVQHSLKLGGTNYHFKWVPSLTKRPAPVDSLTGGIF